MGEGRLSQEDHDVTTRDNYSEHPSQEHDCIKINLKTCFLYLYPYVLSMFTPPRINLCYSQVDFYVYTCKKTLPTSPLDAFAIRDRLSGWMDGFSF